MKKYIILFLWQFQFGDFPLSWLATFSVYETQSHTGHYILSPWDLFLVLCLLSVVLVPWIFFFLLFYPKQGNKTTKTQVGYKV